MHRRVRLKLRLALKVRNGGNDESMMSCRLVNNSARSAKNGVKGSTRLLHSDRELQVTLGR